MDSDEDYKEFEPLSNFDLMKIMMKEMKEKANIIDTRNMNQYRTFNDMWKDRGHCIFFENPEDSSIGHWTSCIRQKANNDRPETCIYFDSYGDKLTNEGVKRILKQKYNFIQYNPKRLQEYNTNLCGVYALIIVILNKLIPNIDIKKILEFFESKEKDENFDQFVYDMAEDL